MNKFIDLAKNIRERRESLKYTQADLAELTDLSVRTIRSIESGEGNTTVVSLLKILNVLGLEMKLQIKSTEDATGESILQ